jgi:predicted small integral membrane protein
MDALTWMAWTPPTAAFFLAIGATLAIYTALGIARPSMPRRGFLPIETTRGDRLFIGLLAAAYINLAWAGWVEAAQWIAAALWLPVMWVVGRWG